MYNRAKKKKSPQWYIIDIPYNKFRRRQWHPTPVLLLGKSRGRRSLVGCSPWGCKESDTTERLHFHFSLSCIGEGNGNPLQCSCLENPRDGGAWRAAICGVAQSRTWLKWLSNSSSRCFPSGFPDRSVGKESSCNAGDPGLIPGSGRFPGEGTGYPLQYSWACLVAQLVNNPPATQETWVRSLGWEDPPEKGKATHASILAWRIPWDHEELDTAERLSLSLGAWVITHLAICILCLETSPPLLFL